MLSTIAEIIRDLLIFVAVITALLIVLLVVVSKMPDTNPLKRILTALSYRLGATLAAGALAIPLEPIPGIDVLYDIGVPIVLIWYWFSFSRMCSVRSPNPKPSLPDHRRVISGVAPRERICFILLDEFLFTPCSKLTSFEFLRRYIT